MVVVSNLRCLEEGRVRIGMARTLFSNGQKAHLNVISPCMNVDCGKSEFSLDIHIGGTLLLALILLGVCQ